MRHKGYIKRIPIVKFVKNIKLKKSVYGVVDFFYFFLTGPSQWVSTDGYTGRE